jgi:hypothetical protein
MSDFDAVLERLLTDPGFTSALAADPASALAGYDLSDDERQLLHAQVSTEAGGDRRVEQRTSKASLFGLLSPLAGTQPSGDPGVGHAVGSAASSYAGWTAPHQGLSEAGGGGDLDAIVVRSGHGDVNGIVGPPARSGLEVAPPAGYHPNVDIDGDGTWDRYTAHGRADGGVDLEADMDHDGRIDFVGHDDNADGIIDRADYDTDGDGQLETHMVDTNRDGWMDRTAVDPTEPPAR